MNPGVVATDSNKKEQKKYHPLLWGGLAVTGGLYAVGRTVLARYNSRYNSGGKPAGGWAGLKAPPTTPTGSRYPKPPGPQWKLPVTSDVAQGAVGFRQEKEALRLSLEKEFGFKLPKSQSFLRKVAGTKGVLPITDVQAEYLGYRFRNQYDALGFVFCNSETKARLVSRILSLEKPISDASFARVRNITNVDLTREFFDSSINAIRIEASRKYDEFGRILDSVNDVRKLAAEDSSNLRLGWNFRKITGMKPVYLTPAMKGRPPGEVDEVITHESIHNIHRLNQEHPFIKQAISKAPDLEEAIFHSRKHGLEGAELRLASEKLSLSPDYFLHLDAAKTAAAYEKGFSNRSEEAANFSRASERIAFFNQTNPEFLKDAEKAGIRIPASVVRDLNTVVERLGKTAAPESVRSVSLISKTVKGARRLRSIL